MKIRIYHTITKEHLIWAAYKCNHNTRTKEKVLAYLKEQISLFGTDESSLFGENYNEGSIDGSIYEEAKAWVERKFD